MEKARRIDSFAMLLAAALLLLICWTVRDRLNDSDLWWHLKTGELIAQTHSIPRADTFSFSAPKAPWVAVEWLSEVTIYEAYRVAGNLGLTLWLVLGCSVLLLTNYLFCRWYCSDARVAFLGAMLVWLFGTVGFAVRPHILGYLLLTLELVILEAGMRRRATWFLALPAVFFCWANIHSSFFLGLMVLMVYAVLSFFQGEVGLVDFLTWTRRSRSLLLLAAILAVTAICANPIGPRVLWFPLDVLFNQPLNSGMVTEWRATPFQSLRGVIFLSASALFVLLPFLLKQRVRAHELALFLAGFWLGWRHERMLFVFGILVAPTLCRMAAAALKVERTQSDRWQINFAAGVATLIAAFCVFPTPQQIQKQIDDGNPWEALLYVRRNGLSGRMLNDYDFGGYLIWAAPERKVFIDGRADMYEPAGVMADYEQWIHLRDTRSLLDKYKIDYCLMGKEASAAQILAKTPGWKQVYSDHKAVVIVRSKSTS